MHSPFGNVISRTYIKIDSYILYLKNANYIKIDSYVLYLKIVQRKYQKMDITEKYAAYETKIPVPRVTKYRITLFSFRLRFPKLITAIDLHTDCGYAQELAGADLHDSLSSGRLAELTYVRLLHVVHEPLRAAFMPRWQYSSLDAARAVMSR